MNVTVQVQKIRSVGVVVIGRNEGERLCRAITSLPEGVQPIYVDSGSMDGSVELAQSLGVAAHRLDTQEPFSPARARREGVERLLAANPGIRWIQFLDGDCGLEKHWIQRAVGYLEQHDRVAVVCGQLREREPERSIYNRVSEIDLKAPPGEICSAGGIFMMRREVYEAVGGFRASLLTREERDLCTRVRMAGHAVVRIDEPMAEHDAGLIHIGQWWRRAIWGGYGDALGIRLRAGQLTGEDARRILRYVAWPIALPTLAIAGAMASIWWGWLVLVPFLCGAAYSWLWLGMLRGRLRRGDSLADAALYAWLHLLRKFPTGLGFAWCFLSGGSAQQRPDPHRPDETGYAPADSNSEHAGEIVPRSP